MRDTSHDLEQISKKLLQPENNQRCFEIAFLLFLPQTDHHFQVAAISFWESKLLIMYVIFCYFLSDPKRLMEFRDAIYTCTDGKNTFSA